MPLPNAPESAIKLNAPAAAAGSDFHVGKISDGVKRDAARAERGEKPAQHQQPKRSRAHRFGA